MSPVSTRLVRLLNMVPYFQANQRITFAEASADLGVSRKQLEADLNQLWMCGLPGYGPGDLIDIEFSGDTIEVFFSAGMDRPLRLTSPEATGLLVALRALVDVPGVVDPEAARSAIAKIESAAGTVAHGANSRRTGARTRRKPRRRGGPGGRARRTRTDHRVLLGVARHAVHAHRRPDPGRTRQRPQLPGSVVPRVRGRAAVPVRPHRRRRGTRRAVRAARTRRRGADGHLAVRRGPVAAVGHAPGGPGGGVDVRLLPDAGAARAARRLLRGGHDLRLRRVDEPALLGFGSEVTVLAPQVLADRVRAAAAAALGAYAHAG